ncbi:TcdA/TcdB pore-forming domain-containing protein [Pseudomonas gingeri]
MKTLEPPCASPPCATTSPSEPDEPAPARSQLLLALDTANAQVTALLEQLPSPTLPEASPAIAKSEQIRQLQQDYLAQLQRFWTQPNGASNGLPAEQWLALSLETQLRAEAQLRSADGTLDTEDRQLIDQVLRLPTRAQREDALPVLPARHRPAVYGITLLGEDAAPWPGAFVITSSDGAVLPGNDLDPTQLKGKKTVEVHSDLGRVVLYTLEQGLEAFASLRLLHSTLQVRLGHKIADRFTASEDKHENLFTWQVRSLRDAQQRKVNAVFAESPTDASPALLKDLVAAADLRDILDIGGRLNQRLQAVQYQAWRQVFKDGSRQDWQRYRTAAGQVQAGRLALGLALLDTLPSTAPADNSATPVIKDQAALDAIVTVLSAENPTTAKPAQAIREAWQYANAASLQLALLDATLEGRIDTRQQQWVRLLLDYPDPATRPMIGTHTLIASALGLWTHPENAPSTLHIIDGILAISSSDPNDPTVVLYIPDAPDDQDLKALSRLADIDPYLVEPQWRNYLAARLKTSGTPIPQAPLPVTGAHVQLIPIPGDVQLGLYTIRRDALLEQARQRDPGATTTDRRSLIDQWALGNVVGQKSAGLIGTFLPGKNALARIRATGQPELAELAALPATERQGPASSGATPPGTVRLRLLGGAPIDPPPALPPRVSAIAGLIRLGSWNARVMDIVAPLMPSLSDWPSHGSLVIIDCQGPGPGWSVRYRQGLHEDAYGFRVNPDMFVARQDVVLYRSAPDHYSAWLHGNRVDAPAGEDSFFHALALALNLGRDSDTFTVERLRDATAEHIERHPEIAPFVTAEHLPLYAQALEHCAELNIWLGSEVYQELTAILKGFPNPYGLFQPVIRYLETTLPSRSPRLSRVVDAAFDAVHQRHALRPLPAEIRQIIDRYIDAPPRPVLSLLAAGPSRRRLLETLLLGPSEAADIDFLEQRIFIFDDSIRHILLEYGATAAQLRGYALQYIGNQITARRDLLRATLQRVPALLERLDIIFSSPTLTPPMAEGINIGQIAHLLHDPHISTTRLRLISRCADAGILNINLLENADGIRPLTDEVLSRLLEHQQELLGLARQMGFQDIAPLLLPFRADPIVWTQNQFRSAPLANARLNLLLDTPGLFSMLRQRSNRVVEKMWTQLTSATHDNARVRHALASPRETLSSLAQLDRALNAPLPNTRQAGPSTGSQPTYLRGYEVHGRSTAQLSGPDARGLYHAANGRTYIRHDGLRYEVRAFGNRVRIIHAIEGFRRPTYEVQRRPDGSWQLIDTPGLGGDRRRSYPAIAEQSRTQREAFATLGQAAQQEWQRLAADTTVSGRVPDLHSLQSTTAGYTLELIDADGAPRRQLALAKTSVLAALSNRIRSTVDTLHQHFQFRDGQLLPRPGVTHHEVVHALAQLDGLNSLNTGFALLLLGSGKPHALSADLNRAVQVQFYTQLALVVMGIANEGALLAQALYLGLKDAGHLGAESIRLLDKAGQGIRLAGKTLTLGGLLAAGNALLVLASLGVDSYLLAHAESAEETATYGTHVGLDSLALGTVLAGFAEGAEFLGPLSIPLAGLGLGASSLVAVFFAKAHKVLATGEQFNREIQAYRNGYVEDPHSHGLRLDGPVVVSHVDQRNGRVHLGSPKIYAVDTSRSGDPRVILDERQAIDVGLVLGLPGEMPLPVSDSARFLHLPITPEHTYLPQYGWLLGATQRNDAELQLFKALEQKTRGKFIEAKWVAVFQKIVEQLEPRYHATRIRVSLGLAAPMLIMDDPGEGGRYLSHAIEGQGSQYDIYLSDGTTLDLSSCETSRPSTWVLHTDQLSRPDDIRLEPGRLTVGSVVVRVRDKETLYLVNKLDEAYRLDLAGGRYTLATLSARDHEDVNALQQRLQALQDLQRLTAPVPVEDLSAPDWPGRGIYYRPADGDFAAIPTNGEDHGDELYQIPVTAEMLLIASSPQREKVRQAVETLAALTRHLDEQYRKFGGRSAGFWSAHPAAGQPRNEQCYGDFLRAQYRLEVQRARLQGRYSDTAGQMLLQLLPRHEREPSNQGPRQVLVHRLSINGYPADDILVIGDPEQGTLLLYVPASSPALSEFCGASGLKAHVQQLVAADATLRELQEHFPRRYRASNYSALWGYTGTDEALENLGDNGDWSLIQLDRGRVDGDDVFAVLASLKRQGEGG